MAESEENLEILEEHDSKEYRDHELQVRRVDAESAGYSSTYDYEIELLVDGSIVMTASQLEDRDWEMPWVPALYRYGRAYVDGQVRSDS